MRYIQKMLLLLNKNELKNSVVHHIKGKGNDINNLEWVQPPVITTVSNSTEVSKLVCAHVAVLNQIRVVSKSLNIR